MAMRDYNSVVDPQDLSVMLILHGYAEYGETMAPISNAKQELAIHYDALQCDCFPARLEL
jgi:hypothetical protein